MMTLEEFEFVADCNVDVAVELDRRMMKMRDILAIRVGATIPLTRAAGENMDLYIGGARIGFGEIVVSDATTGFRITSFCVEN